MKRKIGLGRRRGQEREEEEEGQRHERGEKEPQIGTGKDSEGGEKDDEVEVGGEGRGEGAGGGRRRRGKKNEDPKEEQNLETRNKISTKLFLHPSRPSPSLEKEDLDDQPLSYDEISEFVNVNFGDETDGYVDSSKIHWDYSSERRGEIYQ